MFNKISSVSAFNASSIYTLHSVTKDISLIQSDNWINLVLYQTASIVWACACTNVCFVLCEHVRTHTCVRVRVRVRVV
jgi:hypothetical protein